MTTTATLSKLLRQPNEVIEARKVGSHHRIRAEAIAAYQQRIAAEREDAGATIANRVGQLD